MISGDHVLNPERQAVDRPAKIAAALERIGHIILTSTREAAQDVGLSPIQARILIHIGTHNAFDSRMSSLAQFFDVTVPTVSDAVNSLVQKGLIIKERSVQDARARMLRLTDTGRTVFSTLSSWSRPLETILTDLPVSDADALADYLLRLVSGLHAQGRVAVARMCPYCAHFSEPGESQATAYCRLLSVPLSAADYRLDCPEWEATSRPT